MLHLRIGRTQPRHDSERQITLIRIAGSSGHRALSPCQDHEIAYARMQTSLYSLCASRQGRLCVRDELSESQCVCVWGGGGARWPLVRYFVARWGSLVTLLWVAVLQQISPPHNRFQSRPMSAAAGTAKQRFTDVAGFSATNLQLFGALLSSVFFLLIEILDS